MKCTKYAFRLWEGKLHLLGSRKGKSLPLFSFTLQGQSLSHMGNFLKQDLQRNHQPSLMYPDDGDDVYDSLGSLISHLEAICYVNQQRTPPPTPPYRAGGQQPDLLSLLHSRHRGRQRIEGSRLRKEEEREQVKGRQCCWRTGGWGPGEADQIGALEISHVGALWWPNG